MKSSPAQLVLISFSALFLEMACIRWINSNLPVMAYFNNLMLIAAFLGLGLGAMRDDEKRSWIPRFPTYLLIMMVFVLVLGPATGYAAMHMIVDFTQGYSPTYVLLAVTSVFLITTLLFVPLGEILGRQIAAFGNDSLRAYAFDILGSLSGVVVFAVCSWLALPPWTWFLLVVAAVAVFLRPAVPSMASAGVSLAICVILAGITGGIWSPYYRIDLKALNKASDVWGGVEPLDPGKDEFLGYSVHVNRNRIQDAYRFDEVLERSAARPWVPYYRLPYHFVQPKELLILGGGSGNDTAAAMRYANPEHIHVVEIDPVLLGNGSTIHPDKPYADARVTTVNDDARSYVARESRTFDLIVMNHVDSHLKMGSSGTVRLESFIFTQESFEQVSRLKKPEGVFCLTTSPIEERQWLTHRLYHMIRKAFDQPVKVYTAHETAMRSFSIMVGPPETFVTDRLPQVDGVTDITAEFEKSVPLEPLRDDWPFLYVEKPGIPTIYVGVIAMILVVTLVLLKGFQSGSALPATGGMHFMLLGAGFMILETKSITQFFLLFGTTWLVNAIVISAIFVMILLANQVVKMGLLRSLHGPMVCLLACLLADYFVNVGSFAGGSSSSKYLVVIGMTGLPLFFASLAFSCSFARAPDPRRAFGANLTGVVLGGVLEYLSLLWGLRFLYLLAFAIYLAAYVSAPRATAPATP